jgi:hypothetical protein
MVVLLESESIELLFFAPVAQSNDQLHLDTVAHGGYAKKLANVENPKPANLDVMAQKVRRLTEDHARRAPITANDIVRDQSVAANQELEGALALADAALSEEEYADPVHVHEHSMKLGLRGKSVVEHRMKGVDGAARPGIGHK